MQDSDLQNLNVDAVIKCRYAYEKTASKPALLQQLSYLGQWAEKGSEGITMQAYNGVDGNLLWRFYKAMDDNVMGSTDELMERMMRKVSRNFPYEK